MRSFKLAFLAILAALSSAAAQVPTTHAGLGAPSSGGGSPTWTGATAGVNSACGFMTSCNVTGGLNVTTGIVVAAAYVNNQAAGAGTASITVCGTSLTMDVQPSIAGGAVGISMGHGSVSGGTGCTITVTLSAANSIENIGVALGTLNNLSSSTPGTACTGDYPVTQNSPYPCTTGLTVVAGGFGIVGFGENVTTSITSGNVTVDATAVSSTGTATGVAIGHTTTSNTPQFSSSNFANAHIVGEPFD